MPRLRLQLLHLPVEVRISDLIRMELVADFERGEPPKNIAKRLMKDGLVERFNQKSGIFTLTRMSNNDCYFLDRKSRLCTIYDKRPETCRNHPGSARAPATAPSSPTLIPRPASPALVGANSLALSALSVARGFGTRLIAESC